MRYTSTMRHLLSTLVAVTCASTLLIAQNTKQPKTLTLTGCVEADSGKPGEFTLKDAKAKKTYRLTGVENLAEYVGRRVSIDGGVVVKNTRISGGLQPNPNIAAQAGAMDPSRAAVQAATSGTGPNPTYRPQEFQIESIRAATGSCP